MKRAMPSRQHHALTIARRIDAVGVRIQAEVVYARQLMTEIPGITRPEALKMAAKTIGRDPQYAHLQES